MLSLGHLCAVGPHFSLQSGQRNLKGQAAELQRKTGTCKKQTKQTEAVLVKGELPTLITYLSVSQQNSVFPIRNFVS